MLKVLPPHISNLIAAGEVVQRPASIVKELTENSIDAGASSISVVIIDAGRTLIQVIDNGCGMTPEDAKTSFERHATSKISQIKDLEAILTYGFRGEALASIAAVAEVSLKTRKSDSELGTEVVFAESKLVSQEATSCPIGTNISVRNIFYNVPARRKFLKSDNAEFRQIVSDFTRVALCNPSVELKLSHNNKDIYILKPAPNIKKRILDVVGKNIIKELVEIDTSTEIIKVSGFAGSPEDARKSLGNQYFFVNGRFFKSALLHKAVTNAYTKLISDGHTPSYFVFLEVSPKDIDINIHPSKIEVRFENEYVIFEIINAAVREALGKNSFGPSIDFDMEGAPEIPIPRKGVYAPPPKIDYDPLFNPFNTQNASGTPSTIETPYKSSVGEYKPSNEYKIPEPLEGYGEIFEEKMASSKSILQIQGKYLITAVKSGLLLINIYRANERIFYERFLRSLDNYAPITQTTLFPQSIDLDPNSYSVLMEDPEKLRMLGFEISPFGTSTVVINGLPDGFPTDKMSVNKIIDALIATLAENGSEAMLKAEGRHKIAAALAKSGAASTICKMNNIEAQLLVDTLFACMEPDRTPGGKECMTIITIDELDKIL